jgi:hypothetical protein
MNIQEESNLRVEAVKNLAVKIWKKYKPEDLISRLQEKWDVISSILGVKIIPLIKNEEEVLGTVWGSGSFSTGRVELECARFIEAEVGYAPIKYVAVVTNDIVDSKAAEISKDFKLQFVAIDFKEWYLQNHDAKSERPVKETSFFFPPGSEKVPSKEEIERRFKIRQEFDKALKAMLLNARDYVEPNTISLRGYNFPIMSSYSQIDDTHPADLSYIDSVTKQALYPGWQSSATKKMIDDDIQIYRSSLIAVNPLLDVTQAQSVDSGELLALGPGIPAETQNKVPKEIQNNLKLTDDYFLCALKGTGLMRLWGISQAPVPVVYRTLNDEDAAIKQRAIIVGDVPMSGKNAFGLNLSDLSMLELKL